MIDKKNIQVIRELGNLPPFEWPEGLRHVYLRFESSMRSIKIDNKPATRCIVTDLETDTIYSLLAQTVLESMLIENYSNHAYVGKSFMIIRTKDVNKNYFEFVIKEIKL